MRVTVLVKVRVTAMTRDSFFPVVRVSVLFRDVESLVIATVLINGTVEFSDSDRVIKGTVECLS